MLPINPNLPQPNSPTYANDLNWKLTQILRDMALEINRMSGATWDGNHPVLGGSHLWIDAAGKLRIKSSSPTTDLDGVTVGSQ